MMQTWNPWQEIEEVRRRLNNRVEGVSQWLPATDVVEDADSLKVYMDLPDVDMDSLEVSTEKNILTVKASRNYETSDEQKVHFEGRPKGSFSRRLNIPSSYDLGQIDASYKNGVLTISIARSESTKARTIEVALN